MPHPRPTVNPPTYTASQWNYHSAVYTDGHNDDERDTLLSRHPDYASTKSSHTFAMLLGIFMLAALIGLVIIAALYPSTEKAYEDIRREWKAEERLHQAMRNVWNSEREGWNSERNAIVVERETWQKERENHNLEREEWRKERADEDNWQHQEEEEKRALIIWQDLKPSARCLRYGTREYSATLAHVPLGLDPLKECWKKSIDIHGRQVFPSRCDTQGTCGAVVGHWVIDFNEATCVTWWAGYDNKGCVEQGIHRYESILMNLQNGDDWHEMCATTPGRVQGMNFDHGPTSCASWRSGINAIWLVEDENCP